MTRSFIPLYEEVLGFNHTDAIIDGSYLVIGPEEAVDIAADLIQWKREKGYDVQVATIEDIGSSSSAVDSYIENAFNTWDNPPGVAPHPRRRSGSSRLLGGQHCRRQPVRRYRLRR